ncbi:MAG: nucleoside transporter C-terminal domain-containing protein [Bacteroidia bacterium]|nr:nucleoside transporter C-terminal domain-containing protein [Bacteroidia bacterium]
MILRLRPIFMGSLFCLLAFFQPAFATDTLKTENLVYNWTIADTQAAENKPTDYSGKKSFFDIKADGTFSIKIEGDSTPESGTWALNGDSLVFFYELIPVNKTIDSVTYSAQNNSPLLQLFAEGEEVARQTKNGLNSLRRILKFKASADDAGRLILSGTGKSYTLYRGDQLIIPDFSFTDILRGIIGVVFLLLCCWLLSSNRKAIKWRLVATGMGLQLILAVMVLKVPGVKTVFEVIAGFFVKVMEFTKAGATFLFDGLVTDVNSFGYIFAFQILPTIVFFSALMSILYYLGILQKVVFGFAWVMKRTMGLSGAESLSAAGNIFMGQTEAPLLIKPYVENMTKSEIMTLMTGGMATIAGGVFAAYVGYLGGTDPVAQQLFATHLLIASIMSAPAAIVAAKMLVPETENFNEELQIPKDRIGSNILDAISNGTTDGLKLAVNVGVMLLVFISLIKMMNYFIADLFGAYVGLNDWVNGITDGRYTQFNLEYIFGLIFAPVAWLLGVPSEDMVIVGQMLGEKTIINEFVAYATLGKLKAEGLLLNYKSILIATYALCGFSNFASIGIQIGGIGAIAPGQRKNLASLGFKALVGGSIASFLTAAIAGMIYAL